MKKYFILRYGIERPCIEERKAIRRLTDGTMHCLGMAVPGGTISIMLCDKSIDEIKRVYDEESAKVDSLLPIIVIDMSRDDAYGLQLFLPSFDEMNAEFDKTFGHLIEPTGCNLTLDELLDRIKAVGGRENLTPEEFARLEYLSKNL